MWAVFFKLFINCEDGEKAKLSRCKEIGLKYKYLFERIQKGQMLKTELRHILHHISAKM